MERLRSNGSIPPVFTTTEVAAILGRGRNTVIRAIDAGRMHSFRIPGEDQCRNRLVSARDVEAFAKTNNITCVVPISREILIVTREDIHEQVRALLETALDAVTIFVGTPDETTEIEALQKAKPVLVTYRHGDGSKHRPHHNRVSVNSDMILQYIRQNTLLRCDVYEGNGHARIHVDRLTPLHEAEQPPST